MDSEDWSTVPLSEAVLVFCQDLVEGTLSPDRWMLRCSTGIVQAWIHDKGDRVRESQEMENKNEY